MFVDRPDAFALDYNSSLFQSLQGDGVGAPTAVHPAGGGGGGGGRAVRNSVTGSSPLVLHFNGGWHGMVKRSPWQCLALPLRRHTWHSYGRLDTPAGRGAPLGAEPWPRTLGLAASKLAE